MSTLIHVQLFVEPTGAFDGQGMHGNAVGVQFYHLFQGFPENIQILSRQAGDEVHINVLKARFPGLTIGADGILSGMGAAHPPEGFVAEGLRIHGNAVHAAVAQHGKLLRVDGIGPSRFHRPFHRPRELFLGRREDSFQIGAGNGRGRTATHIGGANLPPRPAHHLSADGDFVQQRVHIGLYQLAFAQFSGGEGAIGAAGGAEGNADVQIKGVFRHFPEAFLHQADVPKQRRPFRGNVVFRRQPPHSQVSGQAVFHALVQQPRGANARQRPPGQSDARHLLHQPVQPHFCRAFPQPFEFQGRLRGDFLMIGVRFLAAAPQIEKVGAALGAFLGNHRFALVRADGHVPPEKANDVAQIGIKDGQWRFQPNRFRRHLRYLLHSSSMVVLSPWPGYTRTSRGSASSVRREESN